VRDGAGVAQLLSNVLPSEMLPAQQCGLLFRGRGPPYAGKDNGPLRAIADQIANSA